MPRVSVVITSYNSGLLIGETLDSILTQSYRDFEIIVVDGGSTDNTIEVDDTPLLTANVPYLNSLNL